MTEDERMAILRRNAAEYARAVRYPPLRWVFQAIRDLAVDKLGNSGQ